MIELADVIKELRAELDRARTAADDSALRFGLGPVQLEVTVALDREGSAGGKVRFWVAEAKAEAKVSSTSTQRITLTLNPTLGRPGDEEARTTSATSVYVHGTAAPGER
jgi:hypothetical protein